MICPYRKKTETVDGTTSEYYMECYGINCPYYVTEKSYNACYETQPYCNRADTEMFLATHPNYMKGVQNEQK